MYLIDLCADRARTRYQIYGDVCKSEYQYRDGVQRPGKGDSGQDTGPGAGRKRGPSDSGPKTPDKFVPVVLLTTRAPPVMIGSYNTGP